MHEIKLKIALAYKVPRVTKFIDEDIKLIKKLNMVLQRLEKYDKEIYILESLNIIKQLNNVFDLNDLYPIICYYVDIRFHTTVISIIEKINTLDKNDHKKLQELAEDE
jgi:hypothetical protein